MKDTLTPRQAGMLCTLIILANKISLLPSLMYEGAKADGFFVVAFLFLIEIGVLGVFFLLKYKFPNESITEILEKYVGKVVEKIILILLMTFFLFKLLTSYSVGYVYLKQQVYQADFAFPAFICFIPVINHAVVKGIRVISRTIEIYYYSICVGVLFCLAVGLSNFKSLPLFFDTAPNMFFLESFRRIFSFGDFLLLFLIIDKIQLDKKGVKRMAIHVAIGIALVMLIIFLYYSLYQVTAFMHNNALADIITSSVQYGAIGRLDVVAMLTRMFLTYFEMEIFHFAFSEAFCKVFTKSTRAYSVFVFDVIFVVVYFVLIGRFENMILYTQKWLPYLAILTNYVFPLILLVIALLKRKKNEVRYEKNY